jgi:tellurite resistance protein
VICWLLLGSAILNRLFTRPALAAPLVPTMAIETAPPAVAGLAWFALAGPGGPGRTASMIAFVLGGYAVLMVLAQLRLSLVYSRLSFSPGFWAFTFSCAAVVTDALAWLALKRPPGETGYAIAALTMLTGFIAWIAARTTLLAVRGRLFPAS